MRKGGLNSCSTRGRRGYHDKQYRSATKSVESYRIALGECMGFPESL